jgi:DNA-binding HxlR family transcriptional regulator
MKKKQQRRSDCPINFALENFGDTWSLLIIRDMVYFGKKTYGEFLDSDEGIATNILATRLTQLEENGILTKRQNPTDKRKEDYFLTEKGLDLIPIMVEMATWSFLHDPQTGAPPDWIARVNADKEYVTRMMQETVRDGYAIFVGPNNLYERLLAAEQAQKVAS